jgi:hypothetical protein
MKEEEKHFSDFYAEIGLNSSQWRLSWLVFPQFKLYS